MFESLYWSAPRRAISMMTATPAASARIRSRNCWTFSTAITWAGPPPWRPLIMGNPERPELGEELTNSFCRTDPEIAKHFARTTFMSDNREDLAGLETRTLVLQCKEDVIAPHQRRRIRPRKAPKQQAGHPGRNRPLSKSQRTRRGRHCDQRLCLRARRNLREMQLSANAFQAEDLEDLFEHAPCGYLSLEPNGRILRANTTFASWVGYGSEEFKGRSFLDLLNVAGRIYYETHFAPLLRMQGHFNEVALEIVTRSKERLPVLVNAAERRDERGGLRFIRITVFNAVDRRRYEQELLEAQRKATAASDALRELNARLEDRVAEEVAQRMKTEEALRQSQKMEVVGQLTGGVAHDFNNLLTVIMGGLDTISRQLDHPPEKMDLARMRRARDMAHHGAQRAATLTSRLLAFSRQQTLAPQKIEPNRLISGIADLLQRTLGETIAFETVSAGGLWQAFADPGRT